MYEGYVDVVEYANWKDAGCDLSPACLECPLPRCIEEEPRGRQKRRLDHRTEAMKELRKQGKDTQEIAAAFSVSERTVQRSLCRSNGNGHHGENSKIQIPNTK
jgi:DNA invertase Pin-like site-specific DNA recombinase